MLSIKIFFQIVAITIPAHKKGRTDDPGNFRPISLLPIFSKIFEKILLKQITNYVQANRLLRNKQFGFQKGLSTSDAINCLP